jgi:hypothetical protein
MAFDSGHDVDTVLFMKPLLARIDDIFGLDTNEVETVLWKVPCDDSHRVDNNVVLGKRTSWWIQCEGTYDDIDSQTKLSPIWNIAIRAKWSVSDWKTFVVALFVGADGEASNSSSLMHCRSPSPNKCSWSLTSLRYFIGTTRVLSLSTVSSQMEQWKFSVVPSPIESTSVA